MIKNGLPGAHAVQVHTIMIRLTEALVVSLRPGGDRVLYDDQVAGFALRITPAGAKLFSVRAYVNGKRRTARLGRFPELSVAQARELALQALADMRRGLDPVEARKARARAKAAAEMTIAELATRWLAEHVRPKLKPKTILKYEQLLARLILPALGNIPVARLAVDDVSRFHASLARIPRSANHAKAIVSALVGFGCALGLRAPGDNPARRVRPYRESQRERFLSETELVAAAEGIAAAERAGKIGPHAAAGLRLALFSGARSGEITGARWEYIDWERRFIRLPDSKNNTPRTIHLSDAAIEVLRGLPRVGPYIVAGAIPGDPYKNLTRAWALARGFARLNDVRLHDLRHSYASLAASQGVSLQMIGKLLGHRNVATTARYAHLARDAAAAVNDELGATMVAAIEKGAPQPASVVKLSRRRPRG